MAINPQTAALNPAALIAAAQQRAKFVPKEEGFVVVQFPGETMRCKVEKVVTDDTVIIRVGSPPISRMHSFRFDEVVGCRRRVKPTGETWEAQTNQDFLAEQDRINAAAQAIRDAVKKANPAKTAPSPVRKGKGA